jgi:hypothetical protein
MARLEQTAAGVRFRGSVESDEDVAHAERLACACGTYRPDDDDEDPVAGAVNCFGCRYRRWAVHGFTCAKARLAADGA